MKLGVCYYPEHWPRERWETDAALMQQLGLSIVRLAEFAWTKMEPASGQYEWGWLDESIEILAAAGHQIILCTPTATPPVWLTRSHPDILRRGTDGRFRDHGTRRHYCPNSPTYRQHSQRIIRAMANRYAKHPALIGWQTDNEIGGGSTARCYCDNCATAFRRWLEARYGRIDTLNDAWGNEFWSQTYQSWDEIRPPDDRIDKQNPSHVLDYFRFSSDSFVEFQQEQIDILREIDPDHFVTHNFMGLYRDLDQFDLTESLDFATWDAYPTANPERWRRWLYPPGSDTSRDNPVYAYDVGEPAIMNMAHALTYGLKQRPFWIMEQQCGHINWGSINPAIRPGTPRLWTWQAVANGADAVLYFRWRATLFAHEQYHSGILRHDASPGDGYGDVEKLRDEMEQLNRVTAVPPTAQVAILLDFDDLWAIQLQPHRHDFNYLRHLFAYFDACQRLGIPVQIVPKTADLSAYSLVLAPTLHMPDDATVDQLTAYVSQGGTLLLGVRSGFKTTSNLVTDQPLPGPLRDLVGATVDSWQSVPELVAVGLETAVSPLTLEPTASYWIETLRPDSETTVAARYTTEQFAQKAAVTEKQTGEGQTVYVGFYPTPQQASQLLLWLANRLQIQPLAQLPAGVFIHQRGDHLILLNYTDASQTAVLANGEAVTIPPRDIAIRSGNG